METFLKWSGQHLAGTVVSDYVYVQGICRLRLRFGGEIWLDKKLACGPLIWLLWNLQYFKSLVLPRSYFGANWQNITIFTGFWANQFKWIRARVLIRRVSLPSDVASNKSLYSAHEPIRNGSAGDVMCWSLRTCFQEVPQQFLRFFLLLLSIFVWLSDENFGSWTHAANAKLQRLKCK